MAGTREVASSARPPANEFNPSVTGWFNTVPLTSNNSTLSRRSAKHRLTNPDIYVKDYIKKRNLILALLVGFMTISWLISHGYHCEIARRVCQGYLLLG